MVQSVIALVTIVVLVGMSLRANRRYRRIARLPMQWSFAGQVNWTAPRRLALLFTPILATGILLGVVILTIIATPRAGQEGYEIPVVGFIAATFIGIHALHLWLVKKTVGRSGS